ncbi:MAG TPA: hypothetical protein VJV75_09645, partial [Candidatus Polarisedimenticolia bacterium]|nr:hypothetical protein [Candidatus Polarisedimenticolia bacterium]
MRLRPFPSPPPAALAGAFLFLLVTVAAPLDAAVAAPAVLTEPPATPDPKALWLFYLHGRIVQEQGRNAVSPDYGPYLYDPILARLAATGVTVVSEVRPPKTEPGAYADRIIGQIKALVAAGVPEERITVVGASMGAWMTLLVSRRLDLPRIGYVVMGTCGEDADREFAKGLHGEVLSVYESSDPLGTSCATLFGKSARIGRHEEVRLDTGLRHGFLYRPLSEWVEPAVAWARTRTPVPPTGPQAVLQVTPADSWNAVRDRLASDPAITEVVLAGGTYPGGFLILPPRDTANPSPLLIRAADGARVVLDGAATLPNAHPVKRRSPVLALPWTGTAVEPPHLFDPEARFRYTEAADAGAVARFPGTMLIEDGRLLFHPPEGSKGRGLRYGLADAGIQVQRPRVTVRGLVLRNFLQRAKWSVGLRADADDVRFESCTVENASIGVMTAGARSEVVGITARDVGCGIYIGSVEARVESCRLFKTRDGFRVPTYEQDDSGIQFYSPAHGGLARDNLVVGFGIGILTKADPSAYWIERNTLVGAGAGTGFLPVFTDPGTVFRANVVAGYTLPLRWPDPKERKPVGGNCYAPWKDGARTVGEAKSVVGDPLFADPAAEDYRLDR